MKSSKVVFIILFIFISIVPQLAVVRVYASACNPIDETYTGPWDVTALSQAPAIQWGNSTEHATYTMKEIYFSGEPYQGNSTRVFAYYAIPKNVSGQLPAIVLAHGGGGAAYEEWAAQWAEEGYVAIALDLMGNGPGGTRLVDGGPAQTNTSVFEDLAHLKDMWGYHSVADVMKAISILSVDSNVDPSKIGVMGVSWGGYTTGIVAGIDDRLAFAMPVYASGYYLEGSVWRDVLKALPEADLNAWIENFDMRQYISQAQIPMFWATGTNDSAFYLDSWRKTSRMAQGTNTLRLIPYWTHDHATSWHTPEFVAYADSIVKDGQSLLSITPQRKTGSETWVNYSGVPTVTSAALFYTTDRGEYTNRIWKSIEATVHSADKKISANIPNGATAYYFNITDSQNYVVSSQLEESFAQKVEAEEYKSGGSGQGYHIPVSGNSNTYRNDDVGIYSSPGTLYSNGHALGETQAGQWMAYEIDVSTGGNYHFDFSVATLDHSAIVELIVDEISKGTVTLPNTGSYQTFQKATLPEVALTTGNHEIKIKITEQNNAFLLDYFEYSPDLVHGSDPELVAISDTFSIDGVKRSVGSSLNGKQAEIGNVNWETTYISYPYDGAYAFAEKDGEQFVKSESVGVFQANVPFIPEVYQVSVEADVGPDVQSDGWMAIGLNKENSEFWSKGQVWMLLYGNGSYQVYVNGAAHMIGQGMSASFIPGGMNKLKLTYDAAGKSVTAWLNDDMVVDHYSLNNFVPDIRYAGFMVISSNVTGQPIDNFVVRGKKDPVLPIQNADLSGLTVSTGALEPTFSPAITSYKVHVGNEVTSLSVTAATYEPTSSISVAGQVYGSGTSIPVSLNVGVNELPVTVIAEGGLTKTYLLEIHRDAASGVNPDDGNGNSSGNGSSNSNSRNNGNSGAAVEKSGVLVVKPGDLKKPAGKDNITIQIAADITQIVLPTDAVELLKGSQLELISDTITLIIPEELLKQLIDQVNSEVLMDSSIVINMNPLSKSETDELMTKASASSQALISLSGKVYDLSLLLVTKAGKEFKLMTFDKPIMMSMKVDKSVNPQLAGIYNIAKNGALEFIRGSYRGGQIKAEINHFSPYAVLEFKKNFIDVPSTHWAANTILELTAQHIVSGTSATEFEPQRTITRAEFTALIVRALNLNSIGEITFKDVPANTWYTKPVAIAVQAGIVTGRDDTRFDPDARITRQEMVTMLIRAYKRMKGTQLEMYPSTPFKDESKVSPWALDAVRAAAALHLIQGRTANEFVPAGITTRAEAAQAIRNFLGLN
ncbi:S-layer homology domain-containing protein [Paenibacillus eucommiae]|uniref:Cephalosporin-C deacetylase-like acetyl esterase n=1 Tax=Paenibacillus eucommiae TaxID=1355755 RepID=A0ABS4J3T3_9BACL|nr:S-layer homology domain-containing protein [Paenibacillus eucommiae]MBP1994504.1 cephalosporin-C deacetylase-like acetyl esterase [Paenibacillus eucommiae]